MKAPLPPDPFRGFAGTVRERARNGETAGDLRKALFLWKVVSRLDPSDEEAQGKTRDLASRLKEAAEGHFRNGTKLAGEGATAAARREFLLTLACDPDHAGARDRLKNRNGEPDVVLYEAREGDTLRKIARERYGDAGMESFVAWFNDLDTEGRLRRGTRLRLPVLDPAPPVESHGKARRDILSYSRERDEAEADRHYRDGVRFYQSGELEKAASEWERTLQYEPDHPRARKDLERVRRMIEKLK